LTTTFKFLDLVWWFMKFTVIIGGAAGEGVAQAAETFGKAMTRIGFYVFNYRDYPSLIRGGHNFNVVTFSSKRVNIHEETADVIIALNEETIKIHSKKLKNGGIIFHEKGLKAKGGFGIDTEGILGEIKCQNIIRNSIFLGAAMKYFDLGLDEINKVFREEYGKYLGPNIMASKRGYDEYRGRRKKVGRGAKGKKYFLTGNNGVGLGALKAGLDIYIAYPMTPATPVLHFLAEKQIQQDILVTQMENEIGVISAALGASYTGAKAMVGTSGGGFALMAETMSMQGISEIPLTVYLAQRTAPGTGVATYSTQGDLKFALNVGHGDFPKVVVAPGDAMESYQRTVEAIYLSEKYRLLSIILGDKHVGESNFTSDKIPRIKEMSARNIAKSVKGLKIYEMRGDGMSQRGIPGRGVLIRGTSYEHDEYGNTTEDPEIVKRMNEKRFRKWEKAKREIMTMEPLKVYGKGKTTIIGWGSTKGVIIDTIGMLENTRFVQICYLSPFPAKQLERIIRNSGKVILVENNVIGQLGDVISEQTGFRIKNRVLKYDSRPMTVEWLLPRIRRFLA
jgi:2-oxoglutarate ferredoxin oxidoreductase subunit alpha